ncbi:hypothetical protein ZHAS_00013145 [Anopheles sinensis]|uniref:Uncharacterized protein n=1 Tax=Anopheles sinensis TaxID=74873 RepID=A0A084W4P0_ANOSI|nr:hypothetical protein ZHAS_00013145 [Anopheles sinensis]
MCAVYRNFINISLFNLRPACTSALHLFGESRDSKVKGTRYTVEQCHGKQFKQPRQRGKTPR